MKKIVFILICFCFSTIVFSQNEVTIELTKQKKVLLNSTEINNNTTFAEVKKMLGEPEIYKEYLSGKVNYHYKENGISVHTINDKLLFIGVNYNWDGDKTFPESAFLGNLKIDGISFTKESKETVLKEIKNLEFFSVMPGLYMLKPNTDKKGTIAIIGIKDTLVTQVGFEFH